MGPTQDPPKEPFLPYTSSDTTFGRHRYIRSKRLDLGTILLKQPPSQTTRYLHLYCDELVWDKIATNGIVDLGKTSLRKIYVFARSFLAGINLPSGIKFSALDPQGAPNRFEIYLYHDVCPPKLLIGHASDPDGMVAVERSNTSTYAGIFLTTQTAVIKGVQRKMGVAVKIQRVSQGELTSLAKADDASPEPSVPINLPSLLWSMFAEASRDVFSKDAVQQRKAMSCMGFVTRCTQGSAENITLWNGANRIFSRMELARLYPTPASLSSAEAGFEVPVLELKTYTEGLGGMITSVGRLEELQRMLKGQEKLLAGLVTLSQSQADDTKKILGGLEISTKSFVNNNANFSEAENAVNDAKARRAEMQERVITVNEKIGGLDNAFKAYMAQLDKASVKANAKSVFSMIAKGITAIFDPPAIADFLISTWDAIDKASDTGNMQDNLSETAKDFLKKIPDLFKELQQDNASFNATCSITPSKNFSLGQATRGLDAIYAAPMDYLGLMVKYKAFSIQSSGAFGDMSKALEKAAEVVDQKVKLDNIKAFNDCAEELQLMVNLGEAVVNADRIAQEKMISYLRGVIEDAERKKVKAQIASTIATVTSKITTDKAESKLTVQALDRLRSRIPEAKIELFASLFECLLSYNYRATLGRAPSDFVVDIDADADTYDTALKNLNKKLMSSDEGLFNFQDAPDSVLVTTDDYKPVRAFQADWKAAFRLSRSVAFAIPLEYIASKSYWHLRATSYYVIFEQDGKVVKDVEYEIKLGPHFLDQDRNGKPLLYLMTPTVIAKVDERGKKVSKSESEAAFILPTPSCSGMISVPKVTTHTKLDFDKLTKISISMTFDGVKRPSA